MPKNSYSLPNDIDVKASTTIAGALGSGFGSVVAKAVASNTAKPVIGALMGKPVPPTTGGTLAGAVSEGAIVGASEKYGPSTVTSIDAAKGELLGTSAQVSPPLSGTSSN